MKPKIREIMEPRIMQERMRGIQGTIHILRKLQHGDAEIKAALLEQYGLSEDEANGYLRS